MLSNYNFNLNPYYDDFDDKKNYYRILFKPGYAVQARELTQLQTQLQDQISKFGDHIFEDGSLVLGGNFFSGTVNYIIVDTGDASSFVSRNFVGSTSNSKARVVKVESIDDSSSKIYFSYITGTVFQQAETIVTTTEDSTAIFTANIASSNTFDGTATTFTIDESVFYVKGHFVFCEKQTIVISKDEPATCRVGLISSERITTSGTDSTLLDPALGSYNYSAPGADRYTIDLSLYSYPYDPQNDDADENSSKDFIELSRYVDGQQVTVNKLPLYSEIENTFARRTYDESGDYTVKAFGLLIKNHVYANTSLLSLQVDPGKAYIKGYEYETIAPTYIDLERSRETSFVNGYPLYANYGKYLLIQGITGDLDYTAHKTLNVFNNIAQTGSAIGNCRVKFIDYDSANGSNLVYKLYLDEVNIFNTTSNSVSDILSFSNVTGDSTFRANIAVNSYSTVATSNVIALQGFDDEAYILPIGKEYTKTHLTSGSTDISYETILRLGIRQFVSNTLTITNSTANQSFVGTGSLTKSEVDENFVVVVTTSDAAGFPVNKLVRYDDGLRVTVNSTSQIYLTCSGINNSYVGITSKITISGAQQKTKTLKTDGFLSLPAANIANLGSIISLSVSDCYSLNSVVGKTNTGSTIDYTNNYELNSGQTDKMYDHGYISLKSGFNNPKNNPSINLQFINVSFSYFEHSAGTGGFFTVDSYTGSGIDYVDIPIYRSSTGDSFSLRDCLDFRPRRTDGSTAISGTLFMTPGSLLYTDFQYYLGRIDRLILTKERRFALIKGISSENPVVPTDIPDSMSLYIISVPPYTVSPSDVSYTYVENKRYTMRDIGKIEKRVERLEFYTALSLLEKQAKDESIPSDVPTIDRFKNGILVDSFAGHSVGDISNPQYRCSIDYENRILRSPFSSQNYTFKYNSGTNVIKSDELVTLAYTTETFLNQPLASTWVNVNPYNVFQWNGFVSLNPSSDNWIDTTTRPDVVVNLNGENDVFTSLADKVTNPASVGVKWSDWQTVVNGVPQTTTQASTSTAVSNRVSDGRTLQDTTVTTTTSSTTTATDTLARAGLSIATSGVKTVTKDLGNKIVDVSIAPFIRSRLVDFSAKALKPTTKMFVTFDSVDVSKYCYPATELLITGTVNANAQTVALSTDANVIGRIVATKSDRIFIIENNKNPSSNTRIVSGNTINWIVNGSTSGSATVSEVRTYSELVTNERGEIAGSFYIPNSDSLRFRTGEKTFRIADDVGESATSAAAVKYVAQGLSQSTERTIVATRVATVAINPVLQTKEVTERTNDVVVSKTTTTKDITPPPPPTPSIKCSTLVEGKGRQGTFTYNVDFGSDIGLCGLNYDAYTVPDRYTIVWDGNEYTTGFVGSSTYNRALNASGFPNVTGPGNGQLRFNKTKAVPATAIIKVDAPLNGTAWKLTAVCPANSAPVSANLALDISSPSTFSFSDAGSSWDNANTSTVTVSVKVERSDNAKITWNRIALTAAISENDSNIPTNAQILSAVTLTPSTVVGLRTGDTTKVDLTFRAPPRAHNYKITITGVATEYSDSATTVPTGRTSTDVTAIRVSTPIAASGFVDPVAQTFFVDSTLYPNGLFVESMDLYFKQKSTYAPISVQLRPTINGYPSSRDVLPFSVVSLMPEQVQISTDASVATNFKFEAPVYLAPGEYSFVVLTNTDQYLMYTARLGDFLLTNADRRITEQPAVGSMFKSQNSSTWTSIQEEDVMFRLNKCIFDTTTVGEVTLYSNFDEVGEVEYDLFFADGEVLDFAQTNIDYAFKTTSLAGITDSSFTNYQLGSNVPMASRRKIRVDTPSDLQFKTILTTQDRNITPVIDLARLTGTLVKNIISNGELSNTDFVITNYGSGYSSNATVTITGTNTTPASAFLEYNVNTGIKVVVTDPGSGYTGNVTATVTGGGATSNAVVSVNNELSPGKGNAVARYITRRVTLASGFESLDLKTYILANIPTGTAIDVYYKVAPITAVSFDEQPWYKMTLESAGAFTETGYADYKYKTSTDTALPSGERFKIFSIKIVMRSSDPVKVPQIRDLRVIALDD